jgi:hypothetical protein
MQCPRCEKENVSGHSYCTYCRAELQTGVALAPLPEGAETLPKVRPGKGAQYFWRFVGKLISAFILFILIAVGRGINWDQVMMGISKTKTGVERSAPKPSKAGRANEDPAKRKADENKSKSRKSADGEETSGFFFKLGKAQEIAADTTSAAGLAVESVEAMLSQDAGLLNIQSRTRAKVYIDGHFSGYTPSSLKLLTGEHRISLMVDGYEEWRRDIRVKSNQQIEIKASLTKIVKP